MKLTRTKLIETIRRKNEGLTTYQARKIAGISIRRVNQVWEKYQHTGQIPVIGYKNGRPPKQIEEWELQIVKEAYAKYRVSADTLERLIERDYSKHIGHNRIHKILLKLNFARRKPSKDIRKKKWKMYERRHSLTAVHIDWHNSGKYWAFGVEDDASRKILSLIECSNATTEKSIEGMNEALAHGSIKQCISDHGTQFIKTISEKEGRFAEFLKKRNIKQILCKVKHPQSNGKIEKWFEVYDRHRGAFRNREEFLHWYIMC
jgi:putative transposase